MNKHIYEDLIHRFEKKILNLVKQGKHNSKVYILYKQVIEDLNKKLNGIKDE